MKITTSNGHEVLIDDSDAALVVGWAWFAVKKGEVWYACRNEYGQGGRGKRNSKRIYMHRAIVGPTPGVVDHINGNGLDNRRENLRVVGQVENQRNRAGAQKNSKSGVRGVQWHKQRQKWNATIRINGRAISLGLYDTADEAARARKAAEDKYWTTDDKARAMLAAAPEPDHD